MINYKVLHSFRVLSSLRPDMKSRRVVESSDEEVEQVIPVDQPLPDIRTQFKKDFGLETDSDASHYSYENRDESEEIPAASSSNNHEKVSKKDRLESRAVAQRALRGMQP
jgi:hypothetical protein